MKIRVTETDNKDIKRDILLFQGDVSAYFLSSWNLSVKIPDYIFNVGDTIIIHYPENSNVKITINENNNAFVVPSITVEELTKLQEKRNREEKQRNEILPKM